MKIKNLFKKISNNFKLTFASYKISMIFIIFTTLFFTIFLNEDDLIFNIIKLFLVISCFESYFIESKNPKNKVLYYILLSLMGLILSFFSLTNKNLLGITYLHFNDLFEMFTFGFIMILFIFSIKNIYKKSNLDYEEFTIRLFNNVLYSSIIYAIAAVSLLLITLIFTTLFLNNAFDSGDYFIKTQLLLFGIFYIPSIIHSIFYNKDKISLFVKNLVKFVLFPLISLAIIIIYFYIIKLLIFGEIPSNVIFRILMGMYIFALPIFIMLKQTSENINIRKVISIFPYIYIPFVILEIYAIFTRVFIYGITPLRYISVALLIFQIISLISLKIKNSFNCMLNSLAIIIFISFLTPLNFQTMSKLDQLSILKRNYREGETLSEIEFSKQVKASSAYKYLIEQEYNKKLIPAYITEEDKEYLININVKEETNYINYYIYDDPIVVEGYKTITNVYFSEKFDNNYDLSNLELYNSNQIIISRVNIEELSKKLIINYDNEDYSNNIVYFSSQNIIEIDENTKLYIKNISFEYQDTIFKYLNLEGYILRK